MIQALARRFRQWIRRPELPVGDVAGESWSHVGPLPPAPLMGLEEPALIPLDLPVPPPLPMDARPPKTREELEWEALLAKMLSRPDAAAAPDAVSTSDTTPVDPDPTPTAPLVTQPLDSGAGTGGGTGDAGGPAGDAGGPAGDAGGSAGDAGAPVGDAGGPAAHAGGLVRRPDAGAGPPKSLSRAGPAGRRRLGRGHCPRPRPGFRARASGGPDRAPKLRRSGPRAPSRRPLRFPNRSWTTATGRR